MEILQDLSVRMGCMNLSCGASTSIEWRKGWPLRSGGFANLCDKCGYCQPLFSYYFMLNGILWTVKLGLFLDKFDFSFFNPDVLFYLYLYSYLLI